MVSELRHYVSNCVPIPQIAVCFSLKQHKGCLSLKIIEILCFFSGEGLLLDTYTFRILDNVILSVQHSVDIIDSVTGLALERIDLQNVV